MFAEIELQEARKYHRLYATGRYGLDSNAAVMAEFFLRQVSLLQGSCVLDIGSGRGDGAAYFISRGLEAVAWDIAPNATAPEHVGAFPVLTAPMWQPGVKFDAAWGFCNYAVQHLPPETVQAALAACRAATAHGCFFQVGLRPDGWGQIIGETLHLSVQDADWWRTQFARHWARVRLLGERPGESATFLCLSR